MIRIRRFIFIFLLFVRNEIYASEETSMVIDDLYSNLRLVAEKMSNELGLHTNCVNAEWNDTINQIDLSFSADRRATIDEARAIALYIINQLIKNLNEQSTLRPYFNESPLTAKSISLDLRFIGPEGRYCDGSVSYMRKADGYSSYIEDQNMLFYYAYDAFSEMKSIKTHEEHYEAAVAKLSTSSLKFPFEHKTTELEAAMDQIFETYLKDMSREKNLIRWSVGGLLSGNVEKIGVIFTYFQPTNLAQGRELVTFATEGLIKAINGSEKLKPFLLEKPFSDQRVRVEIRFRTYQFFNFHDGSLESVVLDDRKVSYQQERIIDEPDTYYSDIVPILQESYYEALRGIKR